eukprot:13678444-Ditylum_brightwellii.AAC.1
MKTRELVGRAQAWSDVEALLADFYGQAVAALPQSEEELEDHAKDIARIARELLVRFQGKLTSSVSSECKDFRYSGHVVLTLAAGVCQL